MNKKALIVASFCALSLCTWTAQAFTPKTTPIINESHSLPNGYDEIILQGDLLYGIGPNAIEAGASDNAVYIQFNQNFGNVCITIYNGNNFVVYSTVVDSSIQQVVIIPITTTTADTFAVVLNNANGHAEGEFDKE